MIYREKIIKRIKKKQMYGKIMLQDQKAKAAVAWANVGRVKSGFINIWLGDKNKGVNYVVISLWLVTSLEVLMSGLQRTLHPTNC